MSGREDYVVEVGGTELLSDVAPLWERLRDHHASRSPHFGSTIGNKSFVGRRGELERKAEAGELFVVLSRRKSDGAPVGYAICAIDGDRVGEVESIYVVEGHRDSGLGGRMMRGGLAWLDERNVRAKVVGVMVGNERALPFYERFGFLPRVTVLAQKADFSGGDVR